MSPPERKIGLFENLALASPWRTPDVPRNDVLWPDRQTLPCFTVALYVVKNYWEMLCQQPRWKVYDVSPDVGDMNVIEHTLLRQVPITAQALSYDVGHFQFGHREIDLSLAAAVSHDLGETIMGDITYDQKKEASDLNEIKAVMDLIDEVGNLDPQSRQQLKELHLRIATPLEEQNILRLLGGSAASTDETDWDQLRALFNLYEKYGYLITAFQVFLPLDLRGESGYLTATERKMIVNWNREELKAALVQGRDVSGSVKAAILAKNVLFNQWSHVVNAGREGIPSAQSLFGNPLTERLVKSVDKLMILNLDLSFFQHTH